MPRCRTVTPGTMRNSCRRVDPWIWSVHKPLGVSAHGLILEVRRSPAFIPGRGWHNHMASANRLRAGCQGYGYPCGQFLRHPLPRTIRDGRMVCLEDSEYNLVSLVRM